MNICSYLVKVKDCSPKQSHPQVRLHPYAWKQVFCVNITTLMNWCEH